MEGWEPERRLVAVSRAVWWKPWTWAPVEWRLLSEPEWDSRSVTRLAGRKFHLDDIGPHGQPMSEALSPDTDPSDWNAKYRYVAEGPFSDHAQEVLDAAQKAFYDAQPKDRPRGGDRWRVRREKRG